MASYKMAVLIEELRRKVKSKRYSQLLFPKPLLVMIAGRDRILAISSFAEPSFSGLLVRKQR